MLQFKQIKEDNMESVKIKPIGKAPHIKSFILSYVDDELTEDNFSEILQKLKEHDFEGDAEYTNFLIRFDELDNQYKIEMDISYFRDNEDELTNIKIEEVEKFYRPVFEDFYKINKPC